MSNQMTVAQRLGLGFGLMLALMVVVTLIGVNRVHLIEQTLTEVSEDSAVKQRYAINMRGNVHDRAIAIRDAILARNGAALGSALKSIEQLDQLYQLSASPMDEALQDAGASPQEVEKANAIKVQEGTTQSLTAHLINLRRQGDIERAQELLANQVSPAYQEWLKRI